MDEPRVIDWTTAEVSGRTLTVELTGEPARTWSSHMEAVLTRLDPKRSSSITVTKRRIKVGSVGEETVDELRHLLESAAQQTNADLVAPPADDVPESDDTDRRLTEAFRAITPVHD